MDINNDILDSKMSTKEQVTLKVAIQGVKGSYHHGVALAYFGEDLEIDDCMSFQDLV